MDALEKAKYGKRAEIDKAKKERLHLYIGEEDVFLYSQDRMRLLEEAEHTGQIKISDVTLNVDIFRILTGKMSMYERSLMDAIVAKYKEVEACESEEEVSKIDATSGLPDMISTTSEDLQAELEENEHNSAEIQAVSLARSLINSVPLADEKALEMQVLYPVWGEEGAEFGKQVEVGFRLQYKPEGETDYTLYEVIQPHALQADWKPSELMALYKVITVEHAGTLDDPIPYMQGMAFEKGKYYEQYGVVYLCILTTHTGYPNDLKDLNTIVQEVKL